MKQKLSPTNSRSVPMNQIAKARSSLLSKLFKHRSKIFAALVLAVVTFGYSASASAAVSLLEPLHGLGFLPLRHVLHRRLNGADDIATKEAGEDRVRRSTLCTFLLTM